MPPADQPPTPNAVEYLDNRIRANHQDYAASVHSIVTIINNLFDFRKSAILPDLAIIALFQVTDDVFSTKVVYEQHTGLIEYIDSTLFSHDHVGTVYFVIRGIVTVDDLDNAIAKLSVRADRVPNLVIITTSYIRPEVADYAATLYETTGGTEVLVLSCSDFIMRNLYFFYQRRTVFLDAYESLLLSQPDGYVGSVTKEVFLTFRRAALTAE